MITFNAFKRQKLTDHLEVLIKERIQINQYLIRNTKESDKIVKKIEKLNRLEGNEKTIRGLYM